LSGIRQAIIILFCIASAIILIGLQRTKFGFSLLTPILSLFRGWWLSYLIFVDSASAGDIERYITSGFFTLFMFDLHLLSYRREAQKKQLPQEILKN